MATKVACDTLGDGRKKKKTWIEKGKSVPRRNHIKSHHLKSHHLKSHHLKIFLKPS